MRRPAILLLGLGSPVLLVALLAGGVWAERVFVAGTLVFPVALCALGAGRRARPYLALLLLVLLAAGLGMLPGIGDGWRVGRGAAAGILWMILGLALLPLLISGLGHAVDRRDDRSRPASGRRRHTPSSRGGG